MLRHRVRITFLVGSISISAMLFAISAFAQTASTRPEVQQKEVDAVRVSSSSNSVTPAAEPKPSQPDNKAAKVAAPESRSTDLKAEVETLKAENADVRELLRKMEEQQKTLLEQVD